MAGSLPLTAGEVIGASTAMHRPETSIITGAQNWGLAVTGVRSTGQVLARIGSAMFAAFALGNDGAGSPEVAQARVSAA
jgi:hypothetical protein